MNASTNGIVLPQADKKFSKQCYHIIAYVLRLILTLITPVLASSVGCPTLPTLLFRVVGLKDTDCFIRIFPLRFRILGVAIQYRFYPFKLFFRNKRTTMLLITCELPMS